MADTEETLGNINSSLQNMVEIQKKMMEGFQTINEKGLDPAYGYSKKWAKEQEKLNKELNKGEGIISRMYKNTKEITMLLLSTKLSFGILNFVKETFEIEQNMMRLGVQMGKGREGGKALYQIVGDIQEATGYSADNIQEMVSTLAKNKFQGDIEAMGSHMLRFAQATGLSVSESSQFAVNLSRVGGLGDKAVMQISAGMAAVQQRVGVSAEGMSALSDSISTAAHNMVAFGKTEQDIRQMAVRTTALVAALEKVGIAARESTSLIEQLTDPERIEENIALYSQLGISIQDALSGGDITDQLGAGLQEMASKAAAMGPIAGAQYAKAFGMSYKTLMKANQADIMGEMGKTAEDMSSDDPQQQMVELMKNTETIMDTMSKTVNRVEGLLRQFSPIMLALGVIIWRVIVKPMIDGIRNAFSKGNTARASVETAKQLETAVEDSLDTAGEKGGAKLSAKISKAMKSMPVIGDGKLIDAVGNKQLENLQKARMLQTEAEQRLQNEIDKQREIRDARQKIIDLFPKEQSERDKLSASQQSLLNYSLKEVDNANKMMKSLETRKDMQENVYNVYQRLSNLTDKDLLDQASLAKQMTTETQRQIDAQIKLNNEKQEQLDKEIDIRSAIRPRLVALNEELKKLPMGTSEYETQIDLIDKLNKQMEESGSRTETINKEWADGINKLTEVENQLKKQKKLENEINNLVADRKIVATGAGGLINEIRRTGQSFTRSMRGALTDVATSIRKGLNNVGERFTKFRQELRNAGGGNALIGGLKKGLGGLMGAMAKLAIPMMILGLVMKMIQPLLDNLMKVLQPLLDVIGGALMKLASTLIKALMPPLLKVLAMILPIAGKLIWVLGALIKGIGYLTQIFDGGAMKDIGQGLMDFGNETDEIADQLRKSADDIKSSNLTNTQATEANTAAQQDGPQDYRASQGTFTAVTTGQQTAVASLEKQKENDNQAKRDTATTAMATSMVASTYLEQKIAEFTEAANVTLNKIYELLNRPITTGVNNSSTIMRGIGGTIETPGTAPADAGG